MRQARTVSHKDQAPATGRPVFPLVGDTYRVWVNRVSDALLSETAHLPSTSHLRRAAIRRAAAIRLCATSVKGYVCEDCGAPAPASGELAGEGQPAGPCHARTCPRCARRRSAEVKEWAQRLHALPVPDKWSWKLWTVTSRYNPGDPADVTVEALRYRWGRYREAWRAAWAELKEIAGERDRERLGAVAAVEIAGTGNVHLHVLMLTPFLPNDGAQIVEAARAAVPEIGHCKIKMADEGAIDEIAKYPMKGPGSSAEAWLGGARATDKTGRPTLMHPALAARCELALMNRRAHDRFGVCRRAPRVESYGPDRAVDDPNRLPEACACGARHSWVRTTCALALWIRANHVRGQVALRTPTAERVGGDLERYQRGKRHHKQRDQERSARADAASQRADGRES